MSLSSFAFAQVTDSIPQSEKNKQASDSIVVGHQGLDHAYREDQFYVGLNINFLLDKPAGVSHSGFSGGLSAGFIRDFPLNNKRNIGVGIGLGWALNTYGSNLLVSQNEKGNSLFQVLDSENYDYKTNRFNTYLLEAPIQFRWRTSNASSYKFWRIYAGFRLGYIYYFRSNFKQERKHIIQTKVKNLNRWRYGIDLTFGYNTFNFTVFYSLNPFFKGRTIAGDKVELSTIKVGLTFYIL